MWVCIVCVRVCVHLLHPRPTSIVPKPETFSPMQERLASDASDAAAHPCRAAPTQHQVSVSSNYQLLSVSIHYDPITNKSISFTIHYHPTTIHYYRVTINFLPITIRHYPIAKTSGETGRGRIGPCRAPPTEHPGVPWVSSSCPALLGTGPRRSLRLTLSDARSPYSVANNLATCTFALSLPEILTPNRKP